MNTLSLLDGWNETHLPVPPIPAEFAPALQPVAHLLYSTRPLPVSLYGLEWYYNELRQHPDSYLAVGHAGRGANSWALHYYMVTPSLAIFMQSGWGGAYMNNERAENKFIDRVTCLRDILQSASRRAGETTRLIIAESDFGRNGFQIPGELWNESGAGMKDALAWLRG